jgi:hypothetical protein
VPSTDDNDTNPEPFARSGSSPSPSVPSGDSYMLCGSSANPSIATTKASEVPASVPPEVGEPPGGDKEGIPMVTGGEPGRKAGDYSEL